LPRHRYDLKLISHVLGLILLAGVALRGACRACLLGLALGSGRAPDHATARLWLMRLGLARLQRPVEKADDWCWLIDHTALLGRQRLLVVLGVRLRLWARRAARGAGALHYQDVRVLHLEAVTDPDGPAVSQSLETLATRAGEPRAITSDRGADILKGIGLFRAKRPAVAEVCDMKHFAANRLKGLLEGLPAWSAFQSNLGKAKAALQQTEWAFVCPPALRTKSRYLNLDVLLRWAAKGRALLALPEAERAQKGDVARLEKALGWLREMEASLTEWGEWLAVSEAGVAVVRQHGLHAKTAATLSERVEGLARSESSKKLAQTLEAFVRDQQGQARTGERLLGSTEVVESLFGTFKALSKEQGKGGVTGLALALPALLGAPTQEELSLALTACPTAAVRHWVEKNLRPNVQQQRCWLRSLLPALKRKKKRSKKSTSGP
jgi:hypothetical protein